MYQDRYSFQTNLKDLLGLTPYNSKKIENNCPFNSSDSFSENDDGMNIFSVTIPYEIFCKIMPISVDYKNKGKIKKYNVLQNGWVDIINDAFLSEYGLPCNFIYKRAKVYCSTFDCTKCITFCAKCEDCGSNLHGWSDKIPKLYEPLTIQIKTKDTRGNEFEHNTKRPLKGMKRSNNGELLLNDSP